jgi:amino-acid N-acetyltransferase
MGLHLQMLGEGTDQELAAEVQQLLAACELPYQDITPAHLEHFVGERNGQALVGVVGLELCGDSALLRSLAVSEQYRGRGIGSALTRSAEGHARSRGVKALYLLTTTAEGFFAGQGYEGIDRTAVPATVQETAEFQTLCPASAACMVKRLWAAF